VIRNILILSLVQVVRLILPLLVLPILIHKVGQDKFGIYMYTLGFSAWLGVFAEYGFNISATRSISSALDLAIVKAVVRGVQSAKFILMIASLPVLVGAIYLVPMFNENVYWAFAAWALALLGAFVPTYYFQGRQNLGMVGIAEAVSGCVTLAGIYFLVESEAQFYRVPLILLVARFIPFGILTAMMNRQIRASVFDRIDLAAGVHSLKEGFHIFVFQSAVSFYTSFNVVFLGFFCTPAQVGAYAAAERLIRAGLGFMAQISNAIFPRLNALKSSDTLKMEKLRTIVLFAFGGLGIIGAAGTWLLGPWVVQKIFPGDFSETSKVLRTLAFVIPAIALSNVLGMQYLLVDRREKLFNAVIGFAAVFNLILAYVLVREYGVAGMATTWVVTEWLILAALITMLVAPRFATKLIRVD
jgi:PST family polysaccharide transporter